jgi:D-sedoheptulose 7-phosphate isomerase
MELSHVDDFFREVKNTVDHLPYDKITKLALELKFLQSRGRLFILGVGGSAANASHMVNDVRKLCGIEAYAPTDNVAELTARTNDEGWESVFVDYLRVSNLGYKDALLILSVGGGSEEHQVSVNLVRAIKYAIEKKAKVFGIVGSSTGATAQLGDTVVIVETLPKWITPIAESFQALVWHCIVSHPQLQINKTKW